MYLYSTTKSYVLTMPLIANGRGGNESTFHQSHVENIHYKAFQRQRTYINELLSQQVILPDFAEPACGYKNSQSYLPVGDAQSGRAVMTLVKKAECSYKQKTQAQLDAQPKVHWIDQRPSPGTPDTPTYIPSVPNSMIAHLAQINLSGVRHQYIAADQLLLSPSAAKFGTAHTTSSTAKCADDSASDGGSSDSSDSSGSGQDLQGYSRLFADENAVLPLQLPLLARRRATTAEVFSIQKVYSNSYSNNGSGSGSGGDVKAQGSSQASAEGAGAGAGGSAETQRLMEEEKRKGERWAQLHRGKGKGKDEGRDKDRNKDEFVIRSLCGMHAGLELELAHTITHLITIYNAIRSYSAASSGASDTQWSKWAIIAHDHARFPLDVDWSLLFASASARPSSPSREANTPPAEPAVLLLTNPNVGLAKQLWWKRIHNVTLYNQWAGADTPANLGTVLWHNDRLHDDVQDVVQYVTDLNSLLHSSDVATAYAINMEVLAPLIMQIVSREEIPASASSSHSISSTGSNSSRTKFRYTINLLSSTLAPAKGKGGLLADHPNPGKVLHSPRGVHLSSVLLSLRPLQTYMLMYPVVVSDIEYKHNYDATSYAEGGTGGGRGGGERNAAQAQAAAAVVLDYAANRVTRTYMNNLIEGSARLPLYIVPACSSLLPLDAPKYVRNEAALLNKDKSKGKGKGKGKGDGKDAGAGAGARARRRSEQGRGPGLRQG